MELRDEYERTEPTTMRQWMLDKRKPNQRYTFWIAVIALFFALVFGLIQSVTGVIQAMHVN
jgi:Ni/Fe-hydrogenase subunit HybB-like protein